MKKGTIFLITLTCLTLMSAQAVSAQTRFPVKADKEFVEVQNKPSGFVIGSLSPPQTFTVTCISKRGARPDWAYGNAHGHTQRTGWVLLDDLALPLIPPAFRNCGKKDGGIAQKKFMYSFVVLNVRRYYKNTKTCQKGVDGAEFDGEATCEGSPTGVAYGTEFCRNFNFRTGARRDCEILDKGEPGKPIDVKWRYLTVRGNYVMVRLPGTPGNANPRGWGFVPFDSIVGLGGKPAFPTYDNCHNPRTDSCCKDRVDPPACPAPPPTPIPPPDLLVTRTDALARLPLRKSVSLIPKVTAAVYSERDYATNAWKGNARRNHVSSDDGDSGAELSVTQDASDDPVVTGSNITYTITVFNNGESAASPFSVSADLPAQTSFVSCGATGGGVCGGTGNNRTVTFGSLAPDEWVTVTLTATVNCSTADATVITNTATLSCSSASECSPPDENTADADEDTEGNNEDFRETVFTTVSDPGPTITAPPAVTAFTGPNATACGAFVSDATLGTATANDNCPGVSITRSNVPANNFFPVGQTVITYTASDQAGHVASATQLVTVIDNTPPVISGVSVDKPSLWPPDHKMTGVTVNYSAVDNCGVVTSVLRVASSEPVNGLGDGDATPDWEILDAHHVRLRAERSGQGSGRVYTITITSTDGSGNWSSKQVLVKVPHDQRR